MLVASIKAKNAREAKKQISTALDYADGFELRLDYWQKIDLSELEKLCQEIKLPIIFTLRKKSQGGLFKGDEISRLKIIESLCRLNPSYIDLEHDTDISFFKKVRETNPKIQIICSYHDFKATLDDLTAVLNQIQNPYSQHYKIATFANSVIDTLRMLLFIQNNKNKLSLTGICMGEQGGSTRMLGPVIGNTFTFASIDKTSATAPGQLSLKELIEIYHFKKLNHQTKIYALLGDPVSKSVGHILYNRAIEILQRNAVYTKFLVKQNEVLDFIKLCRELPFLGFNITMPLKEIFVPQVDTLDLDAEKIQAINMMMINNNQQWFGSTTDGEGAMRALGEKTKINQKKIVILGAGGSAKALAYAAIKHGANVIILNRTVKKAVALAKKLGCKGYGLDKLAELKKLNYYILINTLPLETLDNNREIFTPEMFISDSVVMDVVYQPIKTQFLQMAEQAGCEIVFGYNMYIEQALLQFKYWFNPTDDDLKKIKVVMVEYFKKMNTPP